MYFYVRRAGRKGNPYGAPYLRLTSHLFGRRRYFYTRGRNIKKWFFVSIIPRFFCFVLSATSSRMNEIESSCGHLIALDVSILYWGFFSLRGNRNLVCLRTKNWEPDGGGWFLCRFVRYSWRGERVKGWNCFKLIQSMRERKEYCGLYFMIDSLRLMVNFHVLGLIKSF